jgi:hypothetical protein
MWSTESGARVATAIGVMKWVLIACVAVADVVVAINVSLRDSDISSALWTVALYFAISAAWCLFIWVLFGWFEHTLSALVTIARNTSAVRQRG